MSQRKKVNLKDFIIKILHGKVDIYGFAYLGDIPDSKFQKLQYAVSIALKLESSIVDSILSGPNQAYCDEYNDVNDRLDRIASHLEKEIRKKGYHALSIPASKRTDIVNIKGEFPHKTAATRAGLGWIGRNCLLITRDFGPRIRLSTILTDIPLEGTVPVEKDYCGACARCIDACPAEALIGGKWYSGLAREKLIDVFKCDRWKKENYFEFCEGYVCGICMAVCPLGKNP
jgi:epoxyqueuosine reductase